MAEVWHPARTRVYPDRVRDNPWFRTGSVWRDHKAFLAQFEGGFDRQEEDEDFAVVAPPRPTLRSIVEDRWDDWFNAELADQLRAACEYVQKDLEEPSIRAEVEGQPGVITFQPRRKKRPLPATGWTINLSRGSNYHVAMLFDDTVLREDEHWFWVGSRNYWYFTDTRGKRRSLSLRKTAWLLEYGTATQALSLQPLCKQRFCIAPDHHVPKES